MAHPDGVEVLGPVEGRFGEILTDDALGFLAELHREFEARRRELLVARDVPIQRTHAIGAISTARSRVQRAQLRSLTEPTRWQSRSSHVRRWLGKDR